jgi:hypothetical protein
VREQISGVYDQTLTSGAVLFVIFGRVYDKPQPLRTPSANFVLGNDAPLDLPV